MSDDQIFLALEIVGTIAFSISGAMVGVKKKMDIFGVIILGLCTAVGGGIIRDLILGITPPATFRNSVYSVTSVITSIIIFIPKVRRAIDKFAKFYDRLWLFADSVGLGIFTVTGVRMSYAVSYEYSHYLVVFIAVITGVGGGILRDILADEAPQIFRKHFYATASIIGAIICSLMWMHLRADVCMMTGAILITVLRIMAATFRWKLPQAEG